MVVAAAASEIIIALAVFWGEVDAIAGAVTCQ